MASEVKQRLQDATGCRFSWMRLFHGTTELTNTQRLLELVGRRHRDPRHSSRSSPHSGTLKLSLKVQNPRDLSNGTYVAQWGGSDPSTIGRACERLLASIGQGLGEGLAPALALDGMGGTYVLRDAKRNPVAAFKPRDEEPFAPNNPRGLSGKMGQPGIHPAIPSGESHLREVLAYLLDHRGFAAVPPTMQAEALHPAFYVQSMRPLSRYGAKIGSLQAWVSHADLASDVGVSAFSAAEVHKLAILDMRLLNTDRNDGNVLVVRGSREGRQLHAPQPPAVHASVDESEEPIAEDQSGERSPDAGGKDSEVGSDEADEAQRSPRGAYLVPIDHGLVLPSRPEVVWYNWCWLSWPQMSAPLSEEAIEYIGRLDPIADARAITDAGLPAASARVCRCTTLALQKGVQSGLSLLDIARMLSRDDEDTTSNLERLWSQAERLAQSAMRNHRLRGSCPPPDAAPHSPPGGIKRTISHGSVVDLSGVDSSMHHVALPASVDARAAADGETSGKAPETPTSPSTARRTSLKMHRRVASFSTLIGLDESVGAVPQHGAPSPQAAYHLPSAAASEWDEDSIVSDADALFFTYYERLLDDSIKRLLSRKLAGALGQGAAEKSHKAAPPQPPPRASPAEPPPLEVDAPTSEQESSPITSPVPVRRLVLTSGVFDWADLEEESSALTNSLDDESQLSGRTGRSPRTAEHDAENAEPATDANPEQGCQKVVPPLVDAGVAVAVS